MFKYKIFGYIYESDMELPECEPADESLKADVRIVRRDFSREMEELEKDWDNDFPDKKPEERPNSFADKIGNVYIKYHFFAGYFKNSGPDLIEYHPRYSVEDVSFRQWLLCYSMTIPMIIRKEAIIHCAGLLVPGTDDAVLVCGDSGAGKSTISDALMERGLLFVSDDTVRVDMVGGTPKIFGSNLQKRLCNDVVERNGYDTTGMVRRIEGARDKWYKNMGEEYHGNVPRNFKKMFILTLSDDEEVKIREATGIEKVSRITHAFYRTDIYQAEGMSPEFFTKLANIAKNVRIYVVSRPRNKMTVDEITEKIYSMIYE